MGPTDSSDSSTAPLENRPGILLVGSPNVGKRTLLSRLLSTKLEDDGDTSPEDSHSDSDIIAQGWTIDTKYYTADVTIWTAQLNDEDEVICCVRNLPSYEKLAALVLVFDLSKLESLEQVRKWVKSVELEKFHVVLCVGNKVDLVEGHNAHVEYKRSLLKKSESLEFSDVDWVQFEDNEGRGLLEEEVVGEGGKGVRDLCIEWCVENGIEYVEVCAVNVEFDKCLSVDGDLQGVERVFGALSAHMWPGMVLKGGKGSRVVEPYLPQGEEVSDEESEEFELEYEVLSDGLGEKWEVMDEEWMSASGNVNSVGAGCEVGETSSGCQDGGTGPGGEPEGPLEFSTIVNEKSGGEVEESQSIVKDDEERDSGSHFEFEDLEHLMSEIGGMRDNLRMMPDFQRREMAAKLAMRMAAMFGGDSEDED